MTALGVVKGVVTVALAEGEPQALATFEMPLHAELASSGTGGATFVLKVDDDRLPQALAKALRLIADGMDAASTPGEEA